MAVHQFAALAELIYSSAIAVLCSRNYRSEHMRFSAFAVLPSKQTACEWAMEWLVCLR
jgi:hypothetical protein